MVDALAIEGDEGRGSLRNASGSWQTSFDPEMSEWGNPPSMTGIASAGDKKLGFVFPVINKKVSSPEYIGERGKRGELKHLSTRRKGHQLRLR